MVRGIHLISRSKIAGRDAASVSYGHDASPDDPGECATGHAGLSPPTRRQAVAAALATGLLGAAHGGAQAQQDPAPDRLRPMAGDHIVFASGPNMGKPIHLDDLPEGGPQTLAWAADKDSGVVRNGSRLNQVLVIRLAPDSLDEVTRSRAVDGVVAYSAICTHAQCSVTEWRADKGMLHCPCHSSEYDPHAEAIVTFGPAPRRLAALPIHAVEGAIVVAEPFIGRIGGQV
jgi:rieske iron-sulfur protein